MHVDAEESPSCHTQMSFAMEKFSCFKLLSMSLPSMRFHMLIYFTFATTFSCLAEVKCHSFLSLLNRIQRLSAHGKINCNRKNNMKWKKSVALILLSHLFQRKGNVCMKFERVFFSVATVTNFFSFDLS